MKEHDVPIQSLIDHIKTAVDVDPWAKDIVERLLIEHEMLIECIKGKCGVCPHCKNCDVDENGLLKEQEAVAPTLDETTKRFYRCGVCGEYVGFIDSDPGDPDEKDNYCRNCGKAVKWNERRKKCNENRKST